MWPAEIHYKIIDAALPHLPVEYRHILKAVSEYQDRRIGGQWNHVAFQHALRAPGQRVDQAKDLFTVFRDQHLNQATKSQMDFWLAGNAGLSRDALVSFAMALHAVLDSTSPSHIGFQEWDWRNVPRVRQHIRGERNITAQQFAVAVSATQDLFGATFYSPLDLMWAEFTKKGVSVRVMFPNVVPSQCNPDSEKCPVTK
jgi:hypothetical protein